MEQFQVPERGNVLSAVKTVKISELSIDQLLELMRKRNLIAVGNREDMEYALKSSLGSSEVEVQTIHALNGTQLDELLDYVSAPPLEQNGIEKHPVANKKEKFKKPIATEEKKTIRQAQQELARNCGYGNEIIWDLLPSDEAATMKNKIKQLIPDQEKGQRRIENLRSTIFENVWEQRKYTNRTSVSYIFYVMVTKDDDFNTAPNSTEFSCHPVFRCKKCDDNSNTSNCCMIYIDETGRVYQNWKSYINENVLPAGTMVTPRKGIYNFKNDEVILDIYCTPNGTAGAKALNVAQTGAAVAGIGASVVPIAAIALPIAAPVVAAATVIGLGVGAFTSITSALHLRDRSVHAQSINVTNSEARSSYLGMVGGALGMAAAGATHVLNSVASAGKATAGIEILVNGMNVSSIVLSGTGVANGVLDLIFKYKDGDTIETLDVLQLSASLVLFTHSVYNFQLASQIANNARANSIKSYRETLSNRQRKIFDKMSKETVRIRGSTKGKMDILRSINEIPDRQYLNDLFKINKQLNQRKVRPAFGETENIVLNNELPVETNVLRQSVQHGQGPNILEQITQPIPPTQNGEIHTTQQQTSSMSRLLYSSLKTDQNKFHKGDGSSDRTNDQVNRISILENIAMLLPTGVTIFLKQYGRKFVENIVDDNKFQDVLLSMADNLPELSLRHLLKLAQNFIENCLDEIHQVLKLHIPTESVLYRILKYTLENYRDLNYQYISQKSFELIESIKKYYLSLLTRNPATSLTKCPDCVGMTSICEL